jgi:hypothetical protein
MSEEQLKGISEKLDSEKKKQTSKEVFNTILKEYLTPEEITEHLKNIEGTKWKEDEALRILTPEEQKKVDDYDRLKVKNLPEDWEKQLLRKDWLEKNQVDYEQVKKDLGEWTKAFSPKTPSQVLDLINAKEKDSSKAKDELDKWKNIFPDQDYTGVKDKIDSLNAKVDSLGGKLKEWERAFPEQTADKVRKEVDDLKAKLKEWGKNFDDKDLTKAKDEWEALKKRPDIPITQKEFWDDYARREKTSVSEARNKELTGAKKNLKESNKERESLWLTIGKFLEAGRIKRYILSRPIKDVKDARNAIAELLEKTETQWELYLKSSEKENLAVKNLDLILTFKDEKIRERAKQVLSWIKEARTTFEYQKLFERWSGGPKYNVEYDYDGSLYLLWKYLEVKDDPSSPSKNPGSDTPIDTHGAEKPPASEGK